MEDLKKNKKPITLCIEPDPILRKPTTPVDQITDDLLDLFDDMIKIMGQFDGIGLAGPQVGFLCQQFIMKLKDQNL